MTDKENQSEQAADLQWRAEESGREKAALSPEETRRILHELRMHQIELKMQNEELRQAQEEREAACERYFELYDLAPMSYVTLSEEGLILEANLSTATLMGVARGALVKQPLSNFIFKEDKDIYYLYRKQLLETRASQTRELRMVKSDGTAFWAHLEATTTQDTDAPVYRVILSDITERKRMEEVQIFLAKNSTGTQGETFFEMLARHLGESLDMVFVCIDRLEGDGLTARTVAVWCDGKFEDNVSYALKDTPCGEVVGKSVCCFPASVSQFFPRDQVLHDLRAESYAGATLWSHTGRPIGRIAVIGRKPLTNRSLAETILKMVAVRAASELERLDTEAVLKKAHDELERRVLERTADLLSANMSLGLEIEKRGRREEILSVCLLLSEFAGAHSLDELLTKSLDETERLTGSRIGFFHLLQEDQQTLSFKAWSTSTLKNFCTVAGRGLHYNVDEAGVWVDCIRQRRPVIHNDYPGLTDRKGLPPGHAAIIRALVVPIIRSNRIVAILGVGNKEHDYDTRDIETVSDLANMTWDVVLRKQAEERMYNSHSTLTTVIDGISDPIIMLDAERRVKRINKAARDYYGLSSFQEAVGKLCFEAFQGRSSPCENCETPFSTMGNYSGSYERKGAMNSERIEQVFVDLARDESGAPKASVVRIHDITQARLKERQLIRIEKLSSLGLLVAGITHEINNPNNFIFFNTPILRSYLQFLLPFADEYASAHPELPVFGRPYPVFREDCFKLLDNIEHGSTRINQIVGNLREFLHERGKSVRRWINLKQVVEKGITLCLGRIKKTVKTFEAVIPDNLPPVFTDPLAIEQVMVNLLINAAQATDKDNSWVRLSILGSNEPDGEVILEVSDNGSGMDAETQRKIFDPFFTTKAMGVGTGLGLSITHRLVTELEGRIEVESEVGKGSTFRVRLKSTPTIEGIERRVNWNAISVFTGR